ncbi:hypothetical protein [Oceanobacillus sp. 1P07AA]|uniref:hypothetical protein n=1 Tax=Oceanobacillus sp. 1P07AA TaxID=3132293 RepID=UPI0039A6D179
MIREAIQYIVELGKTDIHYENGQSFSTGRLHLIEEPTASKLQVRSLSGLVDYLKSDFDDDGQIMIQVNSPTRVSAFKQLNSDRNREYLIDAEAMIPEFYFEEWYDPESFNIKLQSTFVKNEDRDIVLKVVGNIREEDVKSVGDNGVSQSVTAKVGIAQVGQVEVPNPVLLKPYRTFVEVEQPASDFIFRMQNGPRCAFFEADGGKWKLEAMRNIREYLEKELEQKINDKKIVVIS